MKRELSLVKAFHNKFKAPAATTPTLIPEDRIKLRYQLMAEEVQEYLSGAQKGDLKNVAKELADILYAVYGTIIEHGLHDKMEAIFREVHNSHMTKDYHQYKMIKGKSYKEANIKQFFEDNSSSEK